MKKNDLAKVNGEIYRILYIAGDRVLAIDCTKKTMPQFFLYSYFETAEIVEFLPIVFHSLDELSAAKRKIAQERYTMIAAAVSVAEDVGQRNLMITRAAKQFKVSKQTIRAYLCRYLVYQDTKSTTVSPNNTGEDIWFDFLGTIFCDDAELVKYAQLLCGLVLIGKVYEEMMIISYGSGRNGKSTFWNTIARILGTYAGKLSAETLTSRTRQNKQPELAELKGRRLIIASEMRHNENLDESTIKQICSTDPIYAAKKFLQPEEFIPKHTLVLYTNHLPFVAVNDEGTWRRLGILPFNAVISDQDDVKNYAEFLYSNAGGAILTWLIEGARKVIELNFKFSKPSCVVNAIAKYRQQSDWFGNFIASECDIGDEYRENSGKLYEAFLAYCNKTKNSRRSTTEFYSTLDEHFDRHSEGRISYIFGIRLKENAS